MVANTARLRESITALAGLRFDHAQIIDGRVTNPAAAALLLQAVEAHVRFLAAISQDPRPKPVPVAVDTATMTDAALYAYYRRTALAEDLRFFLQVRMSDALRSCAEAITTPTARNLASLRTAWRTERQAEDRAAGIPAIGTAEWHNQYIDTRSAEIDLPAANDGTGSHLQAEGLA